MAPIIASLLANGLSILGNAVIAKGKEAIEDKLGVKLPEDGTLPPDVVVKLKQAEMQHEEWLIEAGIRQKEAELSETKAYLADTASARSMNTRINESPNAGWLPKNIASVLALVVVLGGGAMLWTTNQADVRTASVGLITMVLGFYFGTSSGSKRKDETIAALSKGGEA
jgi:hypothetical protein